MSRSLAEIDAMLAAGKSLFPGAEWVEDGALAKLVSAIVDESGTVIGGLSFRLNVQVESAIQRGNAVLVLDSQPIQRLSFRPDHPHVNGAKYPIPKQLRLLSLPPDRTRLYRWSDNREWPVQANLRAGQVVEHEPASMLDAVELFLEACGITAYLPAPPHRPKLEF
jgi:uncharacterized protein YheU (UPF0270 family)